MGVHFPHRCTAEDRMILYPGEMEPKDPWRFKVLGPSKDHKDYQCPPVHPVYPMLPSLWLPLELRMQWSRCEQTLFTWI